MTTIEQRKVLKYYPNAKVLKDINGLFYIGIKPESNFSDEILDLDSLLDDYIEYEDLFEEYLLPHVSSIEAAWKSALVCCKTTQNFNRTHPERMSLDHDDEERITRLSERSDRIQQSIKNNKS